MRGIDQFNDQGDGTVFRDVIMLALLGFVTIVVILLPHLNPPVQDEDIDAPGNVFVQIDWPADANDDVDLWVKAPGERPVGYSNKSGKTFNLLRDDLGNITISDTNNYEVAFSRGAPAGEYIVNIHLYSHRSGIKPLTVRVEVKLSDRGNGVTSIARKDIELVRLGQEITALRFRIGDNGRIVKDSVHDLPHPLRSNG